VVDAAWRELITSTLPELPHGKRARFIEAYALTPYDAEILTRTPSIAAQFEEAARAAKNPKRVANLVQSELAGRLRAKGLELEQSPITMKGVALSADLVEEGTISSKILKDLYDKAFECGEDFPTVYEREKPQQITDTAALEKIITDLIAANPKQVEQYRAGKKTLAGFFVGQVMKATKGQAKPDLVQELVTKKLEG
jgi:aspartyl-tRNA(Asn)/glutamyl-tRNA(Gln) amidotransferase subunit B